MASIDDIFAQIPIDQIAGMVGLDPDTVKQAAGKAVPALVEGMQANAQDPAGAASLEAALGQHASDLDGGVDAAQIDTQDGEKIVKNIFGENTDGVANALADGGGSSAIGKLLPILAPIVLGYLAKKATGGSGESAVPQASGGGLQDLLGSVLGGAGGGGGLGDLLGGLLGGGKR